MRGISKPIILTSLGTAAVAVTLFAVIFVAFFNTKPTHPATDTPTSRSTLTPAPTATREPASGPWQTVAALPFAKNVAFATHDPATGYACGNNGIDAGTSKQVELSDTHDGGATWSAPANTPVRDASCHLYINPSNPQDVVLIGDRCWSMCGDSTFTPARSFDGGQTWTMLILPHGDEQDLVNQPIWVGTTIYFLVFLPGNFGPGFLPPTYELVKNGSGANLDGVDLSALPSENSPEPLHAIWSDSTNLYASLGCQTTCTFAKTSDGGQTWQRFNPTGISDNYFISSQHPGDPALLAQNSQSSGTKALRSVDGGATWTPLPAFPTAPNIEFQHFDQFDMLQAMDGTLLSGWGITIDGTAIVYGLAPNATAWKVITAVKGPTVLLTIATDASGHPSSIWAQGVPRIVTGSVEPVVITHGV